MEGSFTKNNCGSKLKNILFINPKQFGYHMDSYYYCKYSDEYNFTYISFNTGKEKLELQNVDSVYVSYKSFFFIRFLRYLYFCIKYTYKKKYDKVFLVYFTGCSLIRLLNPIKRIILDIRTSIIDNNKYKRYILNLFLQFETLLFSDITVISERLAEKLKISKKKYTILPLGSEKSDLIYRNFNNELNLIYIGTFNGRELKETIKGLKLFYDKYKDSIKMNYTIIGEGDIFEKNILFNEIRKNNLKDIVHLLGYIHRENLNSYLSESNLGVAFVPITDYYNDQPVTKVFDYVLAGLPVIATKTIPNLCIVNENNGILIGDNAKEFFGGLIKYVEARDRFNDRDRIKQTLVKYEWENIAKTVFIPKLMK